MENPIRKRFYVPVFGLALVLTATAAMAADDVVPSFAGSPGNGIASSSLSGATPVGDLAGLAALQGGTGVDLANIAVAISVNSLDQYTVQTLGIGAAVSGAAIRGADIAIGDGNILIGSAVTINSGFNAQQGAMSAFSFSSGNDGGGGAN